MNDGFEGEIIISKKDKKINEEEHSKKGKKNRKNKKNGDCYDQ